MGCCPDKDYACLGGNGIWSRRVGLNHRPTVYETVALPLSYAGSRQDTEQVKQ